METTPKEAVLDVIKSFRLREFDWDGSGGLPLRADVADTISDIYLSEIYAVPEEVLYALPKPSLLLAPNGTVEVAYDAWGYKQLLLTFECQGVVTYIKVYDDDHTSIEGTIRFDVLEPSPEDVAELTELFLWIASE